MTFTIIYSCQICTAQIYKIVVVFNETVRLAEVDLQVVRGMSGDIGAGHIGAGHVRAGHVGSGDVGGRVDHRGSEQGGPGDVVDGLVAVAADEWGAGQGVGAQGGRPGHGGHGGDHKLGLGLGHQSHAGHQGDEGQLKKAKLVRFHRNFCQIKIERLQNYYNLVRFLRVNNKRFFFIMQKN